MKRILVVAVAAILAWGGFTFFSNHAGAEAHAAGTFAPEIINQ